VFHTFLPYSARVGIIGCFAISPNSFVFSHCIWIQHVVRDSRLGLGSCSHDECFLLKLRRALQGAESLRILNTQEKPQIHRARDVQNPHPGEDPTAQGSFLEADDQASKVSVAEDILTCSRRNHTYNEGRKYAFNRPGRSVIEVVVEDKQVQ
jgi:hypothetical protein